MISWVPRQEQVALHLSISEVESAMDLTRCSAHPSSSLESDVG